MEEKNNIPEVKGTLNYFNEYEQLKGCSVMNEIMKIEKYDLTIKDMVMIYRWKSLFEDLGMFPELESFACGAVKISEGSIMIGTIDTVDHEDAPQINFLFKLNDEVIIWFVDISDSGSYDFWLNDLMRTSPISFTEPTIGTNVSWEEAYNLLEQYIIFIEKDVFPEFPED